MARYWGAFVFHKSIKWSMPGGPLSAIRRIIDCSLAEQLIALQASPDGFCVSVQVFRRTDDCAADTEHVRNILEAAWLDVPIEELADARKAIRAEAERELV